MGSEAFTVLVTRPTLQEDVRPGSAGQPSPPRGSHRRAVEAGLWESAHGSRRQPGEGVLLRYRPRPASEAESTVRDLDFRERVVISGPASPGDADFRVLVVMRPETGAVTTRSRKSTGASAHETLITTTTRESATDRQVRDRGGLREAMETRAWAPLL